MSKDLQAQLAAMQAALAAKDAELAAARAAIAKSPKRKVEVPSLTQHNDAGELVQEQTGCEIVSQGGPWTTAVQSARVAKTGEVVVYLRKYQTCILKDASKLREGESVGDRVLRQRSSFRVNNAEQWATIAAFAANAFAPKSEEASA